MRRHNGEREKLYQYMDPVPVEMRSVVIMELCAVPIDWKMLTTLRPKLKIDIEYFSKCVFWWRYDDYGSFLTTEFLRCRLMELGKLQLRTELRDKREYTLNAAVRKCKNKSGVIETRPFTCPDCSEEFCNGRSCCDFNYELYTRVVPKAPSKPKQIPMQPEIAAILAGKNVGRQKPKQAAAQQQSPKGKARARSKSPAKKAK